MGRGKKIKKRKDNYHERTGYTANYDYNHNLED
jgi:hypothetical protein